MMHIIKWKRKLNEYRPPFCYGLGYRELFDPTEVFYLIPINYVVKMGKYISYQWDKHRGKPSWVDRKVKEELERNMFKMSSEFLALLRSVNVTLILDEGILCVQAHALFGERSFEYTYKIAVSAILTNGFDLVGYAMSKMRREIERVKETEKLERTQRIA